MFAKLHTIWMLKQLFHEKRLDWNGILVVQKKTQIYFLVHLVPNVKHFNNKTNTVVNVELF